MLEIEQAQASIDNNFSDYVLEIVKMNSIFKDEAKIRLKEILTTFQFQGFK